MPFHVGSGGAWKEATKAYVGVGGAWKEIQGMWVGVGGAWKQFYQNLTVACPDLTANRTTTSPTNSTSSVSILNDGTYSTTTIGGGTNTGTWLTGGEAANVDVYLSGTGDTPTGSALSTWLNCATTRTWTLTESTNGNASKSFTGTMQFRNATTLAVLDTSAVTITASVTA